MEEIIDAVWSTPAECVQCTVEQFVDVPVRQIHEQIVQVGKVSGRSRVEQSVDNHVHQKTFSSRILMWPFKSPRVTAFFFLLREWAKLGRSRSSESKRDCRGGVFESLGRGCPFFPRKIAFCISEGRAMERHQLHGWTEPSREW